MLNKVETIVSARTKFGKNNPTTLITLLFTTLLLLVSTLVTPAQADEPNVETNDPNTTSVIETPENIVENTPDTTVEEETQENPDNTIEEGKEDAGETPKLSKKEQKEARVLELRNRVVEIAKKKKKTARYVYGASGPRSFDCSGFIMWTYKKIGIELPHYSGAQMNKAKRIKKKNLEKGDLLFYGPGGSQHVAMYIGGGKQIGANNPRVGVVIEPVRMGYWSNRFAGAGRILGKNL